MIKYSTVVESDAPRNCSRLSETQVLREVIGAGAA